MLKMSKNFWFCTNKQQSLEQQTYRFNMKQINYKFKI